MIRCVYFSVDRYVNMDCRRLDLVLKVVVVLSFGSMEFRICHQWLVSHRVYLQIICITIAILSYIYPTNHRIGKHLRWKKPSLTGLRITKNSPPIKILFKTKIKLTICSPKEVLYDVIMVDFRSIRNTIFGPKWSDSIMNKFK